MRFLFRILLILGFSWLAQSFLDFWVAAIVAFLVGFLLSEKRKRRLFGRPKPPARAFLAGFIALFVLWGMSAMIQDIRNGSLLSERVFGLVDNPDSAFMPPAYMLILLTALLGGLLGGASAMTGNLLGEAIKR